jgi:hypothetical protein
MPNVGRIVRPLTHGGFGSGDMFTDVLKPSLTKEIIAAKPAAFHVH